MKRSFLVIYQEAFLLSICTNFAPRIEQVV